MVIDVREGLINFRERGVNAREAVRKVTLIVKEGLSNKCCSQNYNQITFGLVVFSLAGRHGTPLIPHLPIAIGKYSAKFSCILLIG